MIDDIERGIWEQMQRDAIPSDFENWLAETYTWTSDQFRDGAQAGWNAATERDTALARVRELEASADDDDAVRGRMRDLLSGVAVALKGPEPPLTAWSWHDLPELAEAAKARIAHLEGVIEAAPHESWCLHDYHAIEVINGNHLVGKCTCWKARAAGGK